VLPLYKNAMVNLLTALLRPSSESTSNFSGYNLEMVVLSTRPHLTKMIESKFGVNACTLVPLSREEQIEYLTKQADALSGGEAAKKKLEELHNSVRSLMSNQLMLHLYSQVCADGSGTGMLDVYSLYTKFMEKKHEVHISEKEHGDLYSLPTVWRKKQLLDGNLAHYYYVAFRDLTGTATTVEEIVTRYTKICPRRVSEKPSEDKLEELLSYGLIVQETAASFPRFKHRSFAEYFCTKMMTDVKRLPEEVRNALFPELYKDGSNIAEFVSCVIGNDETTVQFVNKGCTEFIPGRSKKLSPFVRTKGKLRDHILANTIDYEENDEIRSWLFSDTYEQIVFVEWLSETKNPEMTLLLKNMEQLLATIVFSTDEEIKAFVNKRLFVGGEIEKNIREGLKKSENTIEVAIKLPSEFDSDFEASKLTTDSLLQRMRKWMSLHFNSAVYVFTRTIAFTISLQNFELMRRVVPKILAIQSMVTHTHTHTDMRYHGSISP